MGALLGQVGSSRDLFLAFGNFSHRRFGGQERVGHVVSPFLTPSESHETI